MRRTCRSLDPILQDPSLKRLIIYIYTVKTFFPLEISGPIYKPVQDI